MKTIPKCLTAAVIAGVLGLTGGFLLGQRLKAGQHEYPIPGLELQDVVAITQAIRESDGVLFKPILSIEMWSETSVRVETGSVAGPLAGGGSIVMLHKEKNGRWKVTRVQGWTS